MPLSFSTRRSTALGFDRSSCCAVFAVSTPALAETRMTFPSETGSDSNVTFGVQPAQRSGPDARPFFSWGATPGATLNDHVAIVNYCNEARGLARLRDRRREHRRGWFRSPSR